MAIRSGFPPFNLPNKLVLNKKGAYY
jgi:hypothetical protein